MTSNAGRPLSGFEFCEPDQKKRYKFKNFEVQPTKKAEEIFNRHNDGETIRELAEELSWPETNVKRLIRNVRNWYDEQQDYYLREIKLGLK